MVHVFEAGTGTHMVPGGGGGDKMVHVFEAGTGTHVQVSVMLLYNSCLFCLLHCPGVAGCVRVCQSFQTAGHSEQRAVPTSSLLAAAVSSDGKFLSFVSGVSGGWRRRQDGACVCGRHGDTRAGEPYLQTGTARVL
jgi:hypothetical protein